MKDEERAHHDVHFQEELEEDLSTYQSSAENELK
jgi:hypothetical protein